MLRKTLFVRFTASFLTIAAPASCLAFDAAATKSAIDAELDKDYPHLDALYKDIHTHPELSFQEVNTAARLAKEMRALGFTVTEHVGKTGVVAIYKNGAGPTVMIRTELDALPMEEKTGLPYASHAKGMFQGKETFVDHSCGHDSHMAAWVGTAKALLALKDQWQGTLMFIGQPAEESVGGAKAMIADGLFTRFGKPDYGFALHVGPQAYGNVFYRPGVMSSNSDSLQITFHGKGGHGSMPDATIDPVLIAGRFIVDVQSVISREKDPAAFGVVTIGSIQSGSAGNIIPDSALLRGTIRSYDASVRDKLLVGITRVAKAEAEMAGAPPPDIDLSGDSATAVNNDAALTERTAAMLKSALGDKVHLMPAPIGASEDYSDFITAGVPSMFFMIGGYAPQRMSDAKKSGEVLPVNHSPFFAPVPEPTIRNGVEAMTLAVMNVLQAKG
jgi:amidohydrolase